MTTSRTTTRHRASSTTNFFRGGDTIDDLTGVLEYAFGAWKLRPIPGEDYTFDAANPRPASPDPKSAAGSRSRRSTC